MPAPHGSEITIETLAARVHRRVAPLPEPATRRAIRENARVSQRDAAKACGVSHTSIADWESGRKSPNYFHIGVYQRLLEALARELADGPREDGEEERGSSLKAD
jgi:DNA-binding transcriptional regulator YiaG